MVGVLLGAVGALLLIFIGAGSDAGTSVLGDLFIFINAASYAVFLVMVKPLMAKYSAVTVMSWCFLVGSIIVLPFGLGEFTQVNWTGLAAPDAWSLAFVVVLVPFYSLGYGFATLAFPGHPEALCRLPAAALCPGRAVDQHPGHRHGRRAAKCPAKGLDPR